MPPRAAQHGTAEACEHRGLRRPSERRETSPRHAPARLGPAFSRRARAPLPSPYPPLAEPTTTPLPAPQSQAPFVGTCKHVRARTHDARIRNSRSPPFGSTRRSLSLGLSPVLTRSLCTSRALAPSMHGAQLSRFTHRSVSGCRGEDDWRRGAGTRVVREAGLGCASSSNARVARAHVPHSPTPPVPRCARCHARGEHENGGRGCKRLANLASSATRRSCHVARHLPRAAPERSTRNATHPSSRRLSRVLTSRGGRRHPRRARLLRAPGARVRLLLQGPSTERGSAPTSVSPAMRHHASPRTSRHAPCPRLLRSARRRPPQPPTAHARDPCCTEARAAPVRGCLSARPVQSRRRRPRG